MPLDSAHGLIDAIEPGNRVDVYAGINVIPVGADGKPINGGQARPMLRLILADVPVLAVGEKKRSGSGTTNVSLRVDDLMPREIAFASDNGKLWLALRPSAGAKASRPDIVTVETLLLGIPPVQILQGARRPFMNARGFNVYAALEGNLGLEAIREALPVGTPVRAVSLAEAGHPGTRSSTGADLVIVGCSQAHDQALEVISAATAQRADRPVVVLYQGNAERVPRASLRGRRRRPRRAAAVGRAARVRAREGAGAAARRRGRRDRGSDDHGARAKGGTGKTVTSSNLAVALALEGKSAVLVDLDLQFGDVGLALGLRADPDDLRPRRLGRLARRREDRRVPGRHPSGARALLAPLRPDQAAAIGTPFLREVFEILRSRYDFLLVDTPPAFTPEVIAAVDASSHLCVVGMLDALSLKDTKLGLETLEQMGYDPKAVTLVLNRADSNVGITQSDVEQLLGRAPDVLVGSDRAIPRALTSGQPIVVAEPRSKAARSYAALAERYLVATGRPAKRCGLAPNDNERRREVAAEGELAMELHERIASSPTGATIVALNGNGNDPFAELKNRIHLALVSELGPRLFDVEDSGAVRNRVESEIGDQLRQETGLSGEDRQRLAAEIADDIFGYGPLERLLSDPTISEIMVNGPKDIWIERDGRLSQTTLTFTDTSHLRRIITKMVGQIGRRIDESSPLVDARLPDGSRVNAIIPPLSLSGPLLTIRKFAQNRFAMSELIDIGTLSKEAAEFLAELHPRPAEHAHLGRHRLGQDDVPERVVGGDSRQRPDRHDRGRGRAPARPAARAPPRVAAQEHRG